MNKILVNSRRALARFARDARGDVNVEAVIFLPFLILTMVATMVFYDVFRKDSLGDKATFTVGDMMSRETDYITPAYIDSTKALFTFLTGTSSAENTLRVSVVQYDAETDAYTVLWSEARGPHEGPMTAADLVNAHAQLPNMVDAEQVIVVDSYLDYNWPLDLGFGDQLLTSRVFTRPRFAPQLVWLGN